MGVRIGKVETFRDVVPDKAQVVKIAEEWGEVYSAWEDWKAYPGMCTDPASAAAQRVLVAKLLDECADVIQATCNLVAAVGCEDFRPHVEACRKRNEERGRL